MNETRRRALFVNGRPVSQEHSRSSVFDEGDLESLFITAVLMLGVICVVAFFFIRSADVRESETANNPIPTLAAYDSRHR